MKKHFFTTKPENQILIMLAFFSVAVGLWKNFRQLWLQDNFLEVSQISTILSLGALISIIVLVLITKYVTLNRIKKFISICLTIKIIALFFLFFLNHTELGNIIKVLGVIDVITEKLILLSMYPLLITIKRSDTLYSKRKLVEYLFSDIGILIGGITIGKVLFTLTIDYNILLLVSVCFLLVAWYLLSQIKQNKVEESNTVRNIIQYIRKDKILIIYLVFYGVGTMAMNIGLGLKILMLTDIIHLSSSLATNYLLIVGIIADAIGILALKYFTPKNSHITINIKFGIRFILYVLAFIIPNPIVIMLAISWSILISTAYENKTDGIYINRVDNDYQVPFMNMRHISGMIGEAMGVALAGFTFGFGIRWMLGLSAFFMIFQILLAHYLIYLRKKEKNQFQINTYQNQGIVASYYHTKSEN